MLPLSVRVQVEQRHGPVQVVGAVPGGDSHHAARVRVGGRERFLKWSVRAPGDLFQAEAHGLRALQMADGWVVPRVLGAGDNYLLLELLRAGAAADAMERLGRSVASLHRLVGCAYGLDRDNYVGPVPQSNAWSADWPSFWARRRLRPFARLAHARGGLSASLRDRVDALCGQLSERLPARPVASRLHGDLWGGNVMALRSGVAVFDPAIYCGHREVDLAMTELFGGFSPAFYGAYRAEWALDPGYEARRPIYQLAPLLIHAALFGPPYGEQVERALDGLRA